MSQLQFATPFGNIKISDTENKLLKGTIYNIVAVLLLLLIAASAVSVYFLFHIFVTPLLWAVLVGTCLFPFKRSLTQTIQGWFTKLEDKNRNIIVGVTLLPLNLFIVFGEWLTEVVIKRFKLFLLYVIGFPLIYSIYNLGIFTYIYSITSSFYTSASAVLLMFGSQFMFIVIMTMATIFIITLFTFDKVNVQILNLISSIIWILTILHLSSLVGNLGLFVFSSLIGLFVVGTFTELMSLDLTTFSLQDLSKVWDFIISPYRTTTKSDDVITPHELEEETVSDMDTSLIATSEYRVSPDDDQERHSNSNDSDSPDSALQHQSPQNHNRLNQLLDNLQCTFKWCYNLFSTPMSQPRLERSMSNRNSRVSMSANSFRRSQENGVNRIFIFLLWSHIIVYSWNNLWLILIMFIAIVLMAIKKVLTKLEITDGICWLCKMLETKFLELVGKKTNILFPVFIRGFVKILLQIDEKVRKMLLYSLDSLVTVFVILALLLATMFLAIFLAFQVQNESLHLIALTSNVLNSTMSSELYSWLPDRQDIEPMIDSVTRNAYVYGREWISKKVDQLFDTNSYNKARIEESALELWEKLYQRIVVKNGTNNSNIYLKPGINRQYSISSLQKNIANMWDVLTSVDVLDFRKISNFLRENLGLFSTVLESVWSLLRSNVSLALSLVTGVFSIIFGGGTVVLNFLVSFVIFLSALFYLLASSDDRYLPMRALSSLLAMAGAPSSSSASGGGPTGSAGSTGSPRGANKALLTLYDSVENGISSVFAVTLKMACFYGFYTTLTHTVTGVNIVVIPSIMAALLAAVPIVGTYWAALPAITELVFINQDYLAAGLLLTAHLVPMYAVDTAIYSEIRETGHPYLTGLAIAGGIYWLGLEGVVIGPLLLCSLVIILNLMKLLVYPDTTSPANPVCTSTPSVLTQHKGERLLKKSQSCDRSSQRGTKEP